MYLSSECIAVRADIELEDLLMFHQIRRQDPPPPSLYVSDCRGASKGTHLCLGRYRRSSDVSVRGCRERCGMLRQAPENAKCAREEDRNKASADTSSRSSTQTQLNAVPFRCPHFPPLDVVSRSFDASQLLCSHPAWWIQTSNALMDCLGVTGQRVVSRCVCVCDRPQVHIRTS